MSKKNWTEQLDLVEQQFNEVAALIASGDAEQLEKASAGLQALCVELIQGLGGAGGRPLLGRNQTARLKNLGHGMASLRQNLARRQAQVDQALNILVPAAAPSTYAPKSSTFGPAMRKSGAFTLFKA